MSGVNEIRSTFLNFFAENGHEIVPSSPLVPRNDPTLMFTNAGMVQFKNVFTGVEKRPYQRATTSQKCVRAGGKHNDLDNVGYTARHHTFFEMLGNFSFGDYFKDRAIELAWNLITKEFGLPEGQAAGHRLSRRRRGVRLWKKIAGSADDRASSASPTSDNFWQMGDTGPCGPCSEIFYRPRRQDLGRASRLGRRRTATASSRSGISSSCSSSRSTPAERAIRCRSPRSTPAWGWSASRRCCRASTTSYEIDLFVALIRRHLRTAPAPIRRASRRPRCASSPTICARRRS